MSVLSPQDATHLAVLEAFFIGSLRTTLSFVYGADPDLASEYISELRKAPPLQRTLALHDDPLDVASLLTGLSVSAERAALYDTVQPYFPDGPGIDTAAVPARAARASSTHREVPSRILLRRARQEGAPLVRLAVFNEIMLELGYQPLVIRAGVASYYQRKGVRLPLPVHITMSHLPGRNADREDVYGLDSLVMVLDSLEKYAQEKRPRSKKVRTLIARLRMGLVRLAYQH